MNKEPTPMSSGWINDVVHKKLLNNLKSNWKREISILDVGTGKWYNPYALQKILKDEGIKVVFTCVDICEDNFLLKGNSHISFQIANLNDTWNFWRFDYVIGTEIIEHLENPYHFIRMVTDSLLDEGVAYITSPNVENLISYARNSIVGLPLRFWIDEPSGHIMPVFHFMMDEAIRRVNKEKWKKYTVEHDYNRSFFPFWKGDWKLVTLPFRMKQLSEINIFTITQW